MVVFVVCTVANSLSIHCSACALLPYRKLSGIHKPYKDPFDIRILVLYMYVLYIYNVRSTCDTH